MRLLVVFAILLLAGFAAIFLIRTSAPNAPTSPVFVTETYDSFPERTVPESSEGVSTSTDTASAMVTPVIDQAVYDALIAEAVDLGYENEYILTETERFIIYTTYHAQIFDVFLKKFPDPEGLALAQDYFMDTFSMTAEEVCALNIDVFGPESYDPYAQQDLGFPSCPGPKEPENRKY